MAMALATAAKQRSHPVDFDASRGERQSGCTKTALSLSLLIFLCTRWSPEQIALTLPHTYPKGHELRVSHETIYSCNYAQPVGELKKDLIRTLRFARNKREPLIKGQDRRGHIPDMLSTHMRPPQIEDRLFPGQWEGELAP